MDYVLGNLGENNKYQPKPEQPFHVYSEDFDENGSRDIVLTNKREINSCPQEEENAPVNRFLLSRRFSHIYIIW